MSKFVEIEVSKIRKAPWNYKEEDPVLQRQLVENIRKNDQLENIIVRQMGSDLYEVVNGNHRLDAFKELKMNKVMCCDVGEISEEHAALIAIETNETKFKSDAVKMAQLLERIKSKFSIDQIAKTLPFKPADMQNYNTMLKFDWDAPVQNPVKLEPVMPQQNTPKTNENRPSVEHSIPDNRTITLKLPTDVAEQFEAQMLRVKKLMFPNELPEQVAITLPVQAMLQILAQTDDEKFK